MLRPIWLNASWTALIIPPPPPPPGGGGGGGCWPDTCSVPLFEFVWNSDCMGYSMELEIELVVIVISLMFSCCAMPMERLGLEKQVGCRRTSSSFVDGLLDPYRLHLHLYRVLYGND